MGRLSRDRMGTVHTAWGDNSMFNSRRMGWRGQAMSRGNGAPPLRRAQSQISCAAWETPREAQPSLFCDLLTHGGCLMLTIQKSPKETSRPPCAWAQDTAGWSRAPLAVAQPCDGLGSAPSLDVEFLTVTPLGWLGTLQGQGIRRAQQYAGADAARTAAVTCSAQELRSKVVSEVPVSQFHPCYP